MPGWLLSPRAHLLASHAAAQAGDADRAGFERDFARACLAGLRQSGDGSRSRPCRITHVDDEYDVMESLGKSFASQRPVTTGDGVFDLIGCPDGTEFWFGVSARARSAR